MKTHQLLFMLAMAVTSTVLYAKTTKSPVSIEKGMPFSKARKQLFKAGWKPFDINKALKRDMQCQGADCELHTSGINEVELCTMDSAICYFHYRRGHDCLRVSTLYERVPDLVINDWSSACAPISPE